MWILAVLSWTDSLLVSDSLRFQAPRHRFLRTWCFLFINFIFLKTSGFLSIATLLSSSELEKLLKVFLLLFFMLLHSWRCSVMSVWGWEPQFPAVQAGSLRDANVKAGHTWVRELQVCSTERWLDPNSPQVRKNQGFVLASRNALRLISH